MLSNCAYRWYTVILTLFQVTAERMFNVSACVQLGLERARFLIEQAMDDDQQDNLDEAFKMYMEAAELCLKLVRCAECTQLGMWIDFRLTEDRLQIRALDMRVSNRWLNFNSSTSGPVSSQGDRILLDSRVCGNESGKTEHSIHGMEASGKLKVRATACAVSHLTHLAWENMTTNMTCGGRVCLCRQLAIVQRTRRLAEDDWQKSGDRWWLRYSNDLIVSSVRHMRAP